MDNILKDSSQTVCSLKSQPNSIKTTTYTLNNYIPSISNSFKFRSILSLTSPSKSLPRLLCRNRSFNDANSSGSNLSVSETVVNRNQTGILFKKVETLFEKIKSSPTLDQATANLLSKMSSFSFPKHTKISPKLLELRPKQNAHSSLFFKDEQTYLKALNKTSYDFYDPFSDNKLILDLYNAPGYTRNLVDTVSTILSYMVDVVSITQNEKSTNKVSPSSTNDTISKVNKPVTILPNSKTQILSSISTKPSVIILNNTNINTNNHQNLNSAMSPGSMVSTSTTIGNDYNNKTKNPFITTVKNNSNYNIQQQQQPTQKDLQNKTIVKCKYVIFLYKIIYL